MYEVLDKDTKYLKSWRNGHYFIHKFSNAAKVIYKRHTRGFSLPNVHYTEVQPY